MKFIKYLPYSIIGIIGLILCLIWGFFFYQQIFSLSDTGLQDRYSEFFDTTKAESIKVNGKDIHYLDVGKETDQLVLLIHGAPGSITDWGPLLALESLHSGYRFIVPDRLGYGKSETWKAEESITIHSDVLMNLLDTIDHQDERLPLVVGHSYGATIAAKMLMDYSDKLRGGIIVSGALSPNHEKIFGISHVVKYRPLRRLMGPMLDVANKEKLSHVASLSTEVQNYEDISKPFRVIHGTADSIVPYDNVTYMQDRVPSELWKLISLQGEDHPLHFTNPEIIAQSILEFTSR